MSIPSNTTPGSYFLIVYTDHDNNVAESNESNNILAAAITITKLTLNQKLEDDQFDLKFPEGIPVKTMN